MRKAEQSFITHKMISLGVKENTTMRKGKQFRVFSLVISNKIEGDNNQCHLPGKASRIEST
jgi:activator of HSP90 ATPase